MDQITLKITYSQAPSSLGVAVPKLFANKASAFIVMADDGLTNAVDLHDRIMNGAFVLDGSGNETSTRQPPLRWSDGCGNMFPAGLGLAMNARGNYNNVEVNQSGAGRMTKDQILALLGAGNVDIENHGFYHGLDGNYHAAGSTTAEIIANNIVTNQQYMLATYGRLPTVGTTPNADQGYAAAFRAAGLLLSTNQSNNGETLYGDSWKRPVSVEELEGVNAPNLYRDFNDENDGSQDSINKYGARAAQLVQDSSASKHCYQIFGMHGSIAKQAIAALKQAFDAANDTFWFCTLQQFAEYRNARANVTVVSDTVSGNVRTLVLDYVNVSPKNLRDDLTLLTSSATGAITGVTQTGADSVAFNAQTGQINLRKTRQITDVAGTARVAGSGGGGGETTPPEGGGGGTPPPPVYSGPTTADPRPTQKLSYDARRIYYSTGMTKDGAIELTDGVINKNPDYGDPVSGQYDIVIPYSRADNARIDSVVLGDSFNSNDPAVDLLYQPWDGGIPLTKFADFDGHLFNNLTEAAKLPAYNGPLKYIVIRFYNKQQVSPSEYIPYGAQNSVEPHVYVPRRKPMASGINGDISDFAEDDASKPGYGDVKLAKAQQAIKLGIPRVFNKPENVFVQDKDDQNVAYGPPTYRINPDHQGYLELNILAWLMAQGKPAEFTICNAPKAIQDSWGSPTPNVNPRPKTADPFTPGAWSWVARHGYNYGALFATGSPAGTDWVTFAEHPNYQQPPSYAKGKGCLVTVTFLNEQTLRYAGPQQYTPPKEYVYALWAFKNGQDGALGAGYGFKTAYPAGRIRKGPEDSADSRNLRAVFGYSGDLHGYNPDGTPIVDFDENSYHLYNALDTGEAVPLDGWPEGYAQTLEYARTTQEFAPNMDIFCTESGYAIGDANGISRGTLPSGQQVNNYRIPPASASFTPVQRAGSWNRRNRHVLLALGIQYLIYDRGYRSGNMWDAVSPVAGTVQEPMLIQDAAFVEGWMPQGCVQNPTFTPGTATVFLYTKDGTNEQRYVFWMPGKAESNGQVKIPVSGSYIATPYSDAPQGDTLAAGTPVAITTQYVAAAGEVPGYVSIVPGTGGGGGGEPEPEPEPDGYDQKRVDVTGDGTGAPAGNYLDLDTTDEQTVQSPLVLVETPTVPDLLFGNQQQLTVTVKGIQDNIQALFANQGGLALLNTADKTNLVNAINELLAKLSYQGLVYNKASNAVTYFATMQGASNAAADGDTVIVRGWTGAQLYQSTASLLYGQGASVPDFIQGFSQKDARRGGEAWGLHIRGNHYICKRKDYEDDGGSWPGLPAGSPGHYYRNYDHVYAAGSPITPFCRLYGNQGFSAPDQFEFYRCRIDQVSNQMLNGAKNKGGLSMYFEDCGFEPTDGGFVFRGGAGGYGPYPAPGTIVIRKGRINASGIFDAPQADGTVSIEAVSTVGLLDGINNMLAGGLRVLATAAKFGFPLPAETWQAGGAELKQPVLLFVSGVKVGEYATIQAAADAVPNGRTATIISTDTNQGVLVVNNARQLTVLTGAGTIAGLIVNSGSVKLRGDIAGAIVCQGGFVDYQGNIAYATTGESQQAIVVTSGRVLARGTIQLNSAYSSCQAIASFGAGSTLDFDGLIDVTNKGGIFGTGAGVSILRGRYTSKDLGGVIANGFAELYATVDTRASASQAPPLSIIQSNGFTFSQTIHSSAELLAAAGVASVVKAPTSSGDFTPSVDVIGSPGMTGAASNVTLKKIA